MIHFEPPPQQRPAWLNALMRLFRPAWPDFETFDRKIRLELGRALTRTIADPQIRAELEEKLNQAEGQLQEAIARAKQPRSSHQRSR